MREQLIKDSALYLSGSLVVQLLSFIGMLLLMRYLTVPEYGQYSYIIEFISIFAFFSDGGFNQYIIKEASQKPDLKESIYSGAQATQLFISGILILLIVAISYLSNTEQNFRFLIVFGIGMALNAYFTPMSSLLIASSRPDLVLYKDTINSLFKVIYIGIGILIKAPVVFFFYIGFVNFLIMLLFFMYVKYREDFRYFFRVKLELQENTLFIKQGLVFTILMTANIIYNKIDIIMLEKMSGLDEVGYYSAATRFIYPFMFISTGFMTAIFPKLVKHSDNPEKFKTIQYLALYYLGGIGIVLSAFLFLSSSLIFHTLFENKFEKSIPVFNILVWYLAIVFIYGSISNNLVAKNRTVFLVYLNLIMIVVNICINLYLIPKYGATGAGISTIICEILILISAVVYWKYTVLRENSKYA